MRRTNDKKSRNGLQTDTDRKIDDIGGKTSEDGREMPPGKCARHTNKDQKESQQRSEGMAKIGTSDSEFLP